MTSPVHVVDAPAGRDLVHLVGAAVRAEASTAPELLLTENHTPWIS